MMETSSRSQFESRFKKKKKNYLLNSMSFFNDKCLMKGTSIINNTFNSNARTCIINVKQVFFYLFLRVAILVYVVPKR
jgi:hypothetical protein